MPAALPHGFTAIPDDTPSRAVVVGFSGGLDSSVLLHLLAAQPALRARGLRALHVHHGLHADADAWAAHCRAACADLGLPLQVLRVSVADAAGEGHEAAARRARHGAFAAALGDGDILALAHHRDDQAETFLLRALRASGPDGLAAMRPWRRFARGWLWRPLLDLPRSALLRLAQEARLAWIDDPANADAAFDRNFLRHRVLPTLRERWPQADAAFARAAALSAETCALLAADDAAALAGARTADAHVLSVTALHALPAARRARVLRCWIAWLGLPALPAQGVARIESDLLAAAAGSQAAFAWHGSVVRRWRDCLHAGRQRAPLPPDYGVQWDGQAPLRLPTGDTLAMLAAPPAAPELASRASAAAPARCFEAPVIVHARRGGERIVLPQRGHSHALKHVLQDLAVPPWLRERLPLLSAADGRLLAAADRAYAAPFAAWLHAHGAVLRWTAA